ncbi:MAG: guanosine monophosphate reductase [Haloferacaceae archaeon]
MDDIRTGLSYGDALLVPKRSPVGSRSDVDLSTRLTPDLRLDRPLLSAPMDTVTEAETAVALDDAGGFGTIHRFLSVDEQAAEVRAAAAAGARVGAAVGIAEDYLNRAAAVLDAGADCLVVDVAHGHLEACLDAVADLRREFDPELIAGNVATVEGVADLAAAGADGVKVGIGPGSHCTTRKVAGVGVPQLTAVRDCAREARTHDVTVVADGGVRSSGDAVKALMAGADTVMLGSLFAGTDEAPGEVIERDGRRYKRSRGMATTAANEARTDKEADVGADEGVEALTPHKGPLGDLVEEFAAGVRSGLSYCGGHTIPEARDGAEFIRVAGGAKTREGAHFDHDWENPGASAGAGTGTEGDADATADD